jgi:two-component system, NarL family, response regulator DesR
MSRTLRLLIAEDVDLVAAAFEALLTTEPGFEVVGRVSRGDEVAMAVAELNPDVAILDVDMPGASGIEAAAEIRDHPCKVLLLTALEGPGHLQRALAAGANGYLLKSTTGTGLVNAIRTVADGGTAMDPGLAVAALRDGPCPLTGREAAILRLVGQGLSTQEIAGELFLSGGTVRNYLSNAMVKLDARTRTDAFATAESKGWL